MSQMIGLSHGKTVEPEHVFPPPGPSGKCCWQYFSLIAVDGLAMSLGVPGSGHGSVFSEHEDGYNHFV
jgi:hypothetical protein